MVREMSWDGIVLGDVLGGVLGWSFGGGLGMVLGGVGCDATSRRRAAPRAMPPKVAAGEVIYANASQFIAAATRRRAVRSWTL